MIKTQYPFSQFVGVDVSKATLDFAFIDGTLIDGKRSLSIGNTEEQIVAELIGRITAKKPTTATKKKAAPASKATAKKPTTTTTKAQASTKTTAKKPTTATKKKAAPASKATKK